MQSEKSSVAARFADDTFVWEEDQWRADAVVGYNASARAFLHSNAKEAILDFLHLNMSLRLPLFLAHYCINPLLNPHLFWILLDFIRKFQRRC